MIYLHRWDVRCNHALGLVRRRTEITSAAVCLATGLDADGQQKDGSNAEQVPSQVMKRKQARKLVGEKPAQSWVAGAGVLVISRLWHEGLLSQLFFVAVAANN